jgi:diguanylate cyclase (GGDEF)-like protein
MRAVGNGCLRAVAQAFRGIVRRDTGLVARYGGEELAAILPHTDLEGAMEVAESVRRAIAALRVSHPENHEGGGVMTASIGVATALSLDGGTTHMPAALLQAADSAIYKAKKLGRNRVEGRLLITSLT